MGFGRFHRIAASAACLPAGAFVACQGTARHSPDTAQATSATAEGQTGVATAASGRIEIPAVDSGATATASTTFEPPHPPPLPQPRDADHRFLRRMLDHHERILLLVHEGMMSPRGHAEHSSAADPAALDSHLDSEKQEMMRLLTKLYSENYSARLPHPKPGAHALDHEAVQNTLISAFKAGVAIIDSAQPTLHNREVRQLAAKIRSSELERLREVEEAKAAAKMKM